MSGQTITAITKQLAAFGTGTEFFLQVIGPNGRPMVRSEWSSEARSAEGVLTQIATLQSRNCKGGHIYIRPKNTDQHHFLLIDDIKADVLERVKADLCPVAVLETSPGNFQVWIRTPAMEDDHHLAVSREIATRYDGDAASTDALHFGRLAGFTNRKAKYARPNGHFPFVYVRVAEYQEAPNAIVMNICQEVSVEKHPVHTKQITSIASDRWTDTWASIVRIAQNIAIDDASRREFWMVCRALQAGIPADAIDGYLAPMALARGKGDEAKVADYVKRTINNARRKVQMT